MSEIVVEQNRVLWYKQCLSGVCLEKVALGNSRGNFFRQPLRTFHCLSEFWIKTVKNMRPRVALGLTLNIFTGAILNSVTSSQVCQ